MSPSTGSRRRDGGDGSNGDRIGDVERRLTLQATGVTLLGVLLSIGITVAFGLSRPWWIRVLAGAGTTLALAFSVWFLGTKTRMLVRLTDWITGRSYR